jgi:hypothetical protein
MEAKQKVSKTSPVTVALSALARPEREGQRTPKKLMTLFMALLTNNNREAA